MECVIKMFRSLLYWYMKKKCFFWYIDFIEVIVKNYNKILYLFLGNKVFIEINENNEVD